MKARAIAVAVPLALGMACTHGQQTGARSTPTDERQATGAPQGGSAGGGPVARDPLFRPGPSIQGHAEDEIVVGRVSSATDSTVTVQTVQGDRRTLQIVPETEIQLEGQDISAAELAQGQPVRASFASVDGQEVAVKIRAGGDELTAPGSSEGTGAREMGTGSAAEGAPAPVAEPPGSPTDSSADWPSDDEREPADPSTAPDAGWSPPTGPGHDGSSPPSR